MGIQIGAKPDSGFDDPLGMLRDCHRRIEHFLGILCLVAERAQGRSLTAEEVVAAEVALQYFRAGGARHTADEEESLFPRLLAVDDFAEFERLERDHEEAGQSHADVEDLYRSWISAGTLEGADSTKLQRATARLRDLYQAHIQVEEEVVFPRARQVLDAGAIRAIGKEFRARRN